LSKLGYCCQLYNILCFQKTISSSRPLEHLRTYPGFCRWWWVDSCAYDEVQWQTNSVMNYRLRKRQGN